MIIQRVQLSGPMSGIADYNRPAFNQVAIELRLRGFEVWNPAELNEENTAPFSWVHLMKKNVAALVWQDALITMDGWQTSKGARIEHWIATELEIHVFEWSLFKTHLDKIRSGMDHIMVSGLAVCPAEVSELLPSLSESSDPATDGK